MALVYTDPPYGKLNPWGEMMEGPTEFAYGTEEFAMGLSTVPVGQIKAIVLYASKEMIGPGEVDSADMSGHRNQSQEVVVVRARIPELGLGSSPRLIPSTNNKNDSGMTSEDWALIMQPLYRFISKDMEVTRLPDPGDVVLVDWRNRRTYSQGQYYGIDNQSKVNLQHMPSANAAAAFLSQPPGTFSKIGAGSHRPKPVTTADPNMSPPSRYLPNVRMPRIHHDYPFTVCRTVAGAAGAKVKEIKFYEDDKLSHEEQIAVLRERGERTCKLVKHRRHNVKGPARVSGGTYTVKYPITNIIIHNPSNPRYFGPARLRVTSFAASSGDRKRSQLVQLKSTSLYKNASDLVQEQMVKEFWKTSGGVQKYWPDLKSTHYSVHSAALLHAAPGEFGDGPCNMIQEHVDPREYYCFHAASGFNERSIGIEVIRPTRKKGVAHDPANGLIKGTKWWVGEKNAIWCKHNDFEQAYELIRWLVSRRDDVFNIPLQFPGVKIEGVDHNVHDDVDAVPIEAYSNQTFIWGTPTHGPMNKKREWQHAEIVGWHAKPKYGKVKKTGLPLHHMKYSRGIMAHARFGHSDGLCTEFYCLMRFMGYNPQDSFALLRRALGDLHNGKDGNATRLPPVILESAYRYEEV